MKRCPRLTRARSIRQEGLQGHWFTGPGESSKEAFMRRLKRLGWRRCVFFFQQGAESGCSPTFWVDWTIHRVFVGPEASLRLPGEQVKRRFQ